MKCLLCDGRGYFPLSNIAVIICDRCHGTGEIEEITNDEWRRTCSTEEFAEFLARVQTDEYEAPIDMAYINVWKSWLKEIHKE